MKRFIAVGLVLMFILAMGGCRADSIKLVELSQYADMTVDGAASLEVVYTYVSDEEKIYEFTVTEQETVKEIMTEIFQMELEKYPDNKDADGYYRVITVKQGTKEYSIDLFNVMDGTQRYLCRSEKVCDLIEKYIEEHLAE